MPPLSADQWTQVITTLLSVVGGFATGVVVALLVAKANTASSREERWASERRRVYALFSGRAWAFYLAVKPGEDAGRAIDILEELIPLGAEVEFIASDDVVKAAGDLVTGASDAVRSLIDGADPPDLHTRMATRHVAFTKAARKELLAGHPRNR